MPIGTYSPSRGARECVSRSVVHATCACTDVDDSELAPREERHAGLRLGLRRQRDRRVHWRRPADHEALVVRVVERDPSGREQPADEIALAQLEIADRIHHGGMRGLVGLGEHGRLPHLRGNGAVDWRTTISG